MTTPTQRIAEALAVLEAIGVDRAQRNERSALTLLALMDLHPRRAWSAAERASLGVTPMMEWFQRYFRKRYAPNTRETVRRQTLHQFLDLGLVVINEDHPKRPVNSPATTYRISPAWLPVLRRHGQPGFATELSRLISSSRAAQQAVGRGIVVPLPDGGSLHLTPGGQNPLIRDILTGFCPRFLRQVQVLAVGDAGDKQALLDLKTFAELGVVIDPHGKMPDVVAHDGKRDWLILIEAVTSHGPIDRTRRNALRAIFGRGRAGLVFVTAFATRAAMVRFLGKIAWESEVWIAEEPEHLIHFNGERFLGPYPADQGH